MVAPSRKRHPLFLVVAPENGYYRLSSDAPAVTVNGYKAATSAVYLRQGLNLVETTGGTRLFAAFEDAAVSVTLYPEDMTLSGCRIEDGRLVGISSEGGEAAFTVTAEKAGPTCLTFVYSNNQEGGFHAYNVDLIEAYFTLTANGQTSRVWCRNTQSRETTATVTVTVDLQKGENVLILSNDGEVRFAGKTAVAPDLLAVSVSPLSR